MRKPLYHGLGSSQQIYQVINPFIVNEYIAIFLFIYNE